MLPYLATLLRVASIECFKWPPKLSSCPKHTHIYNIYIYIIYMYILNIYIYIEAAYLHFYIFHWIIKRFLQLCILLDTKITNYCIQRQFDLQYNGFKRSQQFETNYIFVRYKELSKNYVRLLFTAKIPFFQLNNLYLKSLNYLYFMVVVGVRILA